MEFIQLDCLAQEFIHLPLVPGHMADAIPMQEGYGTGDTLTLTFDQDTDEPILSNNALVQNLIEVKCRVNQTQV